MTIKHSTIESTLERGKYFSGGYYVLMWVAFCAAIMIPAISVVLLILYAFGIIEIEFPEDVLLFIIMNSVAIVSAIALYCIFILKKKRYQRLIELWLQDAVLLYGRVHETGRKNNGDRASTISIEVSFRYNKKKYVRQSGRYVKGLFRKKYDFVFQRYTNHEVKILYSPVYDQVLFPKQILMQSDSEKLQSR